MSLSSELARYCSDHDFAQQSTMMNSFMEEDLDQDVMNRLLCEPPRLVNRDLDILLHVRTLLQDNRYTHLWARGTVCVSDAFEKGEMTVLRLVTKKDAFAKDDLRCLDNNDWKQNNWKRICVPRTGKHRTLSVPSRFSDTSSVPRYIARHGPSGIQLC